MAERLTRTRKYADLRNQIANDREESLETTELNSYQEKLNNVKSQFGRDAEPVFNNAPSNKPVGERPIVTEEVRNAEKESMRSLDDILNSMMNETYNTITPIEEKVEVPVAPVFEQVKPQTNETPTNDFVQKALDGANDYNRKAGNVTLDDLPNTLVDKIRHGEPVVDNKVNEIDDDFSNTVSLEIEKVLAEIKSQKAEEEKKPVSIVEAELVDDIKQPTMEEMVQQKPVQEVRVEAPIQPEPVRQEPKQETFEHPVLTKTLEQPVVEIRNISETMNMQRANEDIVDDTIPFNANKVQEEVIDDEEYEDEEPSKVLNVILGILIFVLVAVLGIIVYYILVAKGIIG